MAYVTINRPAVRNALHSYAYMELRSCWRDIGLDPEHLRRHRHRRGRGVLRGRDVKFLAAAPGGGHAHAARRPDSPIFHWGGGGQPSDVSLDKPLIAAINGFAVGVGLSLALH